MEYKKIQTKKIYEEVAESIISMLKNGDLKPGDKLESVERLAEQFDVGKSTVREALSGLRTMGIVEMRQGEGTYIQPFDSSKFSLPVTTAFLMKKDDVKELYELRKILEGGTAALASKAHKEEDLILIEESLQKMKNAQINESLASSADTDFHMAVANATHNALIINLISNVSNLISETIRETRKVLLYSNNQPDKLYLAHKEIFQAIKNRKPELAREYMYKHLDEVNKELFSHLDKI
ncbi:FadR/GntR family transcriptional regulator [Virgibacillus oceani]